MSAMLQMTVLAASWKTFPLLRMKGARTLLRSW
jgi:hypothetical protein